MFKYGNFREMVDELAGIMATALMAQGSYVEVRKQDLINTLRTMFLMPENIRKGFEDWTCAGFQQAISKACREAEDFYTEYFCSFNRKEERQKLYQIVYGAYQWANDLEE